MITIEQDYIVDTTPERVFEFVSNPINDAQWQSACRHVEMLGDPEPRLGARYQIKFGFLKREMLFIAEISQFEPCQRYAYRSLTGPLSYEGSYILEPVEGGTQVHWVFSAEPGSFFGILPKNIIRKTLAMQTKGDAARLCGLLEQQPSAARAQ